MNKWKSQAEVTAIKKKYPAGTGIELDYMDEGDMPSGLKGIVKFVDDQGQLHMIWENGRSLAVIPGVDEFHMLPVPNVEKFDAEQEHEDEDDLER